MNRTFSTFLITGLSLIMISCESIQMETKSDFKESIQEEEASLNLLEDFEPLHEDGDVNAVIEIPAGTSDKWELNKSTGKLEWEKVDGQPRFVNYIGYPANYGMIPKTLLPKEKGGDGDPLDIIVLGPPVEREQVLKCKIIGLIYLLDRGEQDDKIIAVSHDSPLYGVNSLDELNEQYNGVNEIIQLWFKNYKGKGLMESKGFGDKATAQDILKEAIEAYQESN